MIQIILYLLFALISTHPFAQNPYHILPRENSVTYQYQTIPSGATEEERMSRGNLVEIIQNAGGIPSDQQTITTRYEYTTPADFNHPEERNFNLIKKTISPRSLADGNA